MRQYGATHSNVQIAKMLNEAGLHTGKNLRLTARHVAAVRGIYKISGRWCIPWDPATQDIYRQKVANSFRLNPVAPMYANSTPV